MMVLITYDVKTVTEDGRSRLRKVAKKCQDYGQRVQNSVFECVLDSTQLFTLKRELKELINEDEDSLRFYALGNSYKSKIIHIGSKKSFDVEETLIL
mgnify:FL=1